MEYLGGWEIDSDPRNIARTPRYYVLQALAKRLLPYEQEYTIMEPIGGDCQLILTRMRGRPDEIGVRPL